MVMTGPNIISILPWRDRAMALHPVEVAPLTRWVLPSVKMAHPWKSLTLPSSPVVERALGSCGYLALGLGRRKFWCGTASMCLVRHVVWYAWFVVWILKGGWNVWIDQILMGTTCKHAVALIGNALKQVRLISFTG